MHWRSWRIKDIAAKASRFVFHPHSSDKRSCYLNLRRFFPISCSQPVLTGRCAAQKRVIGLINWLFAVAVGATGRPAFSSCFCARVNYRVAAQVYGAKNEPQAYASPCAGAGTVAAVGAKMGNRAVADTRPIWRRIFGGNEEAVLKLLVLAHRRARWRIWHYLVSGA